MYVFVLITITMALNGYAQHKNTSCYEVYNIMNQSIHQSTFYSTC